MSTTKVVLLLAAAMIAATTSAAAQNPPPAPALPASPDFGADVMPLLTRLGCNRSACHGSPGAKSGLKLSLFGADPDLDYLALTQAAHGRRIDKVDPAKSLLLRQVSGASPHTGGALIPPGSPEFQMLQAWISQGALRGDKASQQVTALEVAPAALTLGRDGTAQVSVTAVFAGGRKQDVTKLAVYSSNDPTVAAVSADGLVRATGTGETAVVIQFLRRPVALRTTVPQDIPFAFPPLAANNHIDELVYAKLKTLGIPPSDLTTDAEFLRRVYLDTIGTLPAPEEARAFLGDPAPDKRAKLIDALLARPEYADYWSLKWADLLRIKSEYPVNVWPKAVHVYYRWLHDCLAQNRPYDQFVRDLVVSGGSNFRSPPCNYYRAMPGRNAQSYGETTAMLFLGQRINCAHCHAHPTEPWTRDDNLGLSAFFVKTTIKGTQEWKEEIVYENPDWALWHPRTKALVKPQLPGGPPLDIAREADPRVDFANWLISKENPSFRRNIVNRVWSWLLGRGIVHEPDDLRPTNPPENPELLDYLADELVQHNYDLKHVFRLILNSRTYQLSSMPNPLNVGDHAHFSHYNMRRLGAEVLLDAVSQVAGNPEGFASWIPVPNLRMPTGVRAIQLPDSDIDSTFLDAFGRPPRDTPFEHDRSYEPQERQSLLLTSSSDLFYKIGGGKRIQSLLERKVDDAGLIEELYYATLSRPPQPEEQAAAAAFLARRKDDRVEAIKDLFWAVMTTKEFLTNH